MAARGAHNPLDLFDSGLATNLSGYIVSQVRRLALEVRGPRFES